MKRRADPFANILNQAADRLFLNAVWLGDDLRQDPSGTLYTLSTNPAAYGTLKPCHDAEARHVRLQNLLTAAKAFVVAERKHRTDAVHQLELELPKPKS